MNTAHRRGDMACDVTPPVFRHASCLRTVDAPAHKSSSAICLRISSIPPLLSSSSILITLSVCSLAIPSIRLTHQI